MRILWVADKLGYGERLHGIGAYFRYVIPALPECSVTPIALRCRKSLQALLAEDGINLRVLNYPVADPRTFVALYRYVRDEKFDLLHLHGYEASTVGRLVGMFLRKPVVIHQHDSVSPAPAYGRVADYLLRNHAFRLIAVSESVAEFALRTRFIERSKICVIPNPVPSVKRDDEASARKWRAQLDIPEDFKIVGSITRFDPVKGSSYLIRAFAELVTKFPKVVLVLFADGPERPRREALARELGVWDRIRFVGFQPNASRHLSAMDCFVLASLNEGLPFALLEALAAGTPTVVSNVGGVPELLRHEETALLVPPGNPTAIAGAISRILNDRSLAQHISDNGRVIGRTSGVDKHVEKLIELYRTAIARQGSPVGKLRAARTGCSKN